MARVVLTTGGTAGHIFPALAVAEALRASAPGAELLFVGGAGGPEERYAAQAGLAFAGLPARGVVGRGVKALGAVVWIARGLAGALRLLARFRPQVVAGFGGYASFCPVLAAGLRRTPVVLHEQNSVAGVVTRTMARLAARVCVSFPGQDRDFGSRGVFTGNPVRGAIGALRHAAAASATGRPPRLLVMGGSQGAQALNQAMAADAATLRAAGLDIWHQTGPRELDAVRRAYAAQGVTVDGDRVRVEAFIADMAAAYGWADLALCRAGASTVAELAVAGVPSVLVPFPHATHDHQTANARSLAQAGAAVLLPQVDLLARGVVAVVLPLLGADGVSRLAAMRAAALEMGRPDAAAAVASEILQFTEARP